MHYVLGVDNNQILQDDHIRWGKLVTGSTSPGTGCQRGGENFCSHIIYTRSYIGLTKMNADAWCLCGSDVVLKLRPGVQCLGLEAPWGQNWKSWSWVNKSWSWTFGLGLSLEEKLLQFFKTFAVILDGSEQGTPWHFVREKSSLPFGSHCLREPSALHAHQHQPQLRGI